MKKIITLLFLFLFQLCISSAWAQEEASDYEGEENSTALNAEKLSNIQLIRDNLTNLKQQLVLKEKMLAETSTQESKLALQTDIEKLKKRYDKSKLNLISVITDIKLEDDNADKPREPKKRDLMQEFQKIIGPALDSFQRISAKPRRIQRLKNRIAQHEEQLTLLDQAAKNLDQVKTAPEFQALISDIGPYVSDAIDNITDKKQEHILIIEGLNNRLARLNKEKKSVWQTASDGFRNFLATKGKNLLISFLVFFAIFWPMLKFREKVLNRFLIKHTDEWYAKPIKAFYGITTVAISTSVALATLSALGDWLLVTLTILGLTALLWASKKLYSEISHRIQTHHELRNH